MRRRASLAVTMLVALTAYSSIAAADGIAVAPLPDGSLQLFVVSKGKLLTAWKTTPDPNSAWTPPTDFSPPPSGGVIDVAVGRLPDGRLELFITGSGGIATSWKQSTQPNAPWANWVPF